MKSSVPLPPGLAVLAAILLLGCLPVPAAAAESSRSLEILDFYLYPDDRTEKRKTEFGYPDVREISAVVQVKAEGYKAEENLTVFLVIFDEDDKTVQKHKVRFKLPAGTHDLVLNDIMATSDSLAERRLSCKVEVTLKGSLPAKDELDFSVSGPELPRVEIRDMLLYNPALGRNSSTFDPGDSFILELEVEISDNPARMAPTLVLYAVSEEDAYDTDPHETYQPFNENWDRLKLSSAKDGGVEGLYRLTAEGRMPRFYAQPYDSAHEIRIYAIVDWGLPEPGRFSGQETEDYASGEVFDYYPGESRASQDLRDRLVELRRAYTWQLSRVRSALPDNED
ncbi:hypothetical protein IT575_01770 [bacterium]|nr:hypothetical protein [bacterium]